MEDVLPSFLVDKAVCAALARLKVDLTEGQ